MRRFVLGAILLSFAIFWPLNGVAQEVVKIGVIGPMTGGIAYFGTNWKMGVDLAVSQINSRGGIQVAGKRYLLEAIAYDSEAKAEKAVPQVLPFKESVYERSGVDETGQGLGEVFVGEIRGGKPIVISK